MRILPFLLLCFVFQAKAQTNRSAQELARENIASYIHEKLFKGKTYQSGTFHELQPIQQKGEMEPGWSILHEFNIESKSSAGWLDEGKNKTLLFVFYLDKKMNVTMAEQVR